MHSAATSVAISEKLGFTEPTNFLKFFRRVPKALVGASIEVAGERLGWLSSGRTWVALMACFGLRYLSLRYKWNLPRSSESQDKGS